MRWPSKNRFLEIATKDIVEVGLWLPNMTRKHGMTTKDDVELLSIITLTAQQAPGVSPAFGCAGGAI